VTNDTVSVLEGNTFVLGRRNGDVDPDPGEPHGLFHREMRHLSGWLLTVDRRENPRCRLNPTEEKLKQ
jgi:hypothetical protein